MATPYWGFLEFFDANQMEPDLILHAYTTKQLTKLVYPTVCLVIYRARQIKNKPIINIDPKAAQIELLNDQVQLLQLKLMQSANYGAFAASGATSEVYPHFHAILQCIQQ